MEQILDFLQACIRKEISTDDLGYLTKWALSDYNNLDFDKYLNKVRKARDERFFDSPNKISLILSGYDPVIPIES